MEDVERRLAIDNLKMLIEIERQNFSIAITRQVELPVLAKMREKLTQLRHELILLEGNDSFPG